MHGQGVFAGLAMEHPIGNGIQPNVYILCCVALPFGENEWNGRLSVSGAANNANNTQTKLQHLNRRNGSICYRIMMAANEANEPIFDRMDVVMAKKNKCLQLCYLKLPGCECLSAWSAGRRAWSQFAIDAGQNHTQEAPKSGLGSGKKY